MYDQVARHHIDLPFTGSVETPNLDNVLDYQFGPEVKNMMLALMGRTLFPVKTYDRWELFPFLFGAGGTGKSLVLQCVDRMFRSDAVARFAGDTDGRFSLESFIDAEVIIGTDMPADITNAIEDTDMQKMCSGEPVVVNRKHKKTVRIPKWKSHTVFASNYPPS